MIIVVECRHDVGSAYVSGLDREGVASAQFIPSDAVDWFSSTASSDLAAVQGVLLGDGGHLVSIVRGVRHVCQKPIIALCERRCVEDTLNLFALGVDDVVAKPVHVREILARVKTISGRRTDRDVRHAASDVVIYMDGRDPLIAGEPMSLPRRERRILECLADARGAWVSKEHLFNQVYGLFNEDINDAVIESHISRLRKRIRARLGRDVVAAQRFLGYRFEDKRTVTPCAR